MVHPNLILPKTHCLSKKKNKTGRDFHLLIVFDFRLNSSANIDVHNVQLHSENALEIIDAYDIVVDCTDNVATRYLLNDACVMLKKPLVSGSALQVCLMFLMSMLCTQTYYFVN